MAFGKALCVCRTTQRTAVLEEGLFLSIKKLLKRLRIIRVEEYRPHTWYASIARVPSCLPQC